MTCADKNFPLYTKEHDGTVQKWYVFGWYGPRFAVSTVKNAYGRCGQNHFHKQKTGTFCACARQMLSIMTETKAT